jgi:hypothetical protein
MEKTAKNECSGGEEYRFGKSTFRKIIEYRLIPMMDLIFGEQIMAISKFHFP